MQNVQVTGTASALAPVPFITSKVSLTKQEHIQLKQQANQWHAMWKAACDREQKVRSEVTELKSNHKIAKQNWKQNWDIHKLQGTYVL